VATFRKRGRRWYVEVYVDGKRRGKSVDTKGEGAAWALRMEAELRQADGPPRLLLGEACARYRQQVVPQHKGEKWERIRLLAFERDAIAGVALADLTTARLAEWRDARLREVSPGTVKRELVLLGCVLEACRLDWGLLSVNPLRDLRKPKAPPARRNRISTAAVDAMVQALGYVRGARPVTLSQRVAMCFLLCLESAMRSGEVLGLTWADVRPKSVRLPATKNGDAREVPLSTAARALLDLLGPGEAGEPVAGVSAASRDALWRKAKGRAAADAEKRGDAGLKRELAALRFHDSRAEAIFRLSKRLDVLELARMVGHRDPRSLMLYYNSTAEELAAKLG
jgi:integrase